MPINQVRYWSSAGLFSSGSTPASLRNSERIYDCSIVAVRNARVSTRPPVGWTVSCNGERLEIVGAKAGEARLPRLFTTALAASRSTGTSVRFSRLDIARVHARSGCAQQAGRTVRFSRGRVLFPAPVCQIPLPFHWNRHRQHPVLI